MLFQNCDAIKGGKWLKSGLGQITYVIIKYYSNYSKNFKDEKRIENQRAISEAQVTIMVSVTRLANN